MEGFYRKKDGAGKLLAKKNLQARSFSLGKSRGMTSRLPHCPLGGGAWGSGMKRVHVTDYCIGTEQIISD